MGEFNKLRLSLSFSRIFFFKQNSPCVFHNKMLKLQEAKEMGGRHGAGDSEGCARKVMESVAWIMAKEWTIQNG